MVGVSITTICILFLPICKLAVEDTIEECLESKELKNPLHSTIRPSSFAFGKPEDAFSFCGTEFEVKQLFLCIFLLTPLIVNFAGW